MSLELTKPLSLLIFMHLETTNQNHSEMPKAGGILDAVLESEQAHELADFNPGKLAGELLNRLRERERKILFLRYGLSENKQHTLEAIGNKLNLTRERVRQVEKESMKALKKTENAQILNKSMDVVRKTITDHGGVFEQNALVDHLLISAKVPNNINALIFLLELSDHFSRLSETDLYHQSWHVSDFNTERFNAFHDQVKKILEDKGEPLNFDSLREKFRDTQHYQDHRDYYQEHVIGNLLSVTKTIKTNPFGEYGLRHWRVIEPKDVGDKAYLVLKYEKKPLHYTQITELINQHGFDKRTAYKETVHNELIMDERFVLVGRGIYALVDWGYKKGLVADIIKGVLETSAEPIDRNKLVEEVLKQRVVRRNTILVGLANKQLFRKVGKNKYTLA